ncbi:hypothetical protein KC872_00805 [Candidatus Kaiserbacteria bacterium]|nr:hypothetical protein [Candidatus Kaiserbacteria bacterium]
MRSVQGRRASSDADFYIIGHTTEDRVLMAMSNDVRNILGKINIPLDGFLNGSSPDVYINIDDIEGIIQRGDLNLLSAVF